MRGEIVVRPGKEAFEIRPSVEWDKGKTLLWLLEKSTVAGGEPPWPLCVGDDRTDEDAFREIGERGVTVYVGTPRQDKGPLLSQKRRGGGGISRKARTDQKEVTPWRN